MPNSLTNKLKKFFRSPDYRFRLLDSYGFYKWMSDKKYLKRRYRVVMGKELDLNNPQSFSEKMQWLKLYDRKPIYTSMVDKHAAKIYVANIIGEEYIIPTLGVWKHFQDIDFDSLPEQFVLKATHDSSSIVICRDKKTFNIAEAREKLGQALRHNFYWDGREWPYKNVKPRIIAEKYMEDDAEKELVDYKFYCFNGVPQYLYVSKGLANPSIAQISFLTLDWQFAPFRRIDYEPFAILPEKPKQFEKMLELAKKFSFEHDFLRVDFYEINNQLYFSEFTFTPCKGFMPVYPDDWDKKLGSLLSLSRITS